MFLALCSFSCLAPIRSLPYCFALTFFDLFLIERLCGLGVMMWGGKCFFPGIAGVFFCFFFLHAVKLNIT
ncbi:hypothetical protein BC829DRAFT_405420 [Chytridium lagenaria]|nr:hypothetical protein BC829DRAFT_405420 [Chytridium lagenaria]